MFEYAVRKLAFGVLVVFAVTVILFAVMQLMPGDPIRLIANPRMTPEKMEQLRHQWGLDQPVYVQYFFWLARFLHGDFGTSIVTGQPVSFLIATRLPYTLALAGLALLLEYALAVPLGLIAAVKQNSALDRGIVFVSTILWSVPTFWLGILLMLLLAVKIPVFPISGYSGPLSIVLPALTLTLPALAGTLRLTRSEVLEAVREPYVLTAYAKGLPSRAVLIRHVLRNALIPVTMMFFLSLPWLLGGSVVVESIFSWPGMGRLLWKSIGVQDLPVVQGIVVIIAVLTVISNVAGDIVAGLLDPRIRLEIEGGER